MSYMEKELKTDMALLKKDMDYIRKDVSDIKRILESNDKRYASKLTERIVYGMVGFILLGVLAAVVALVIK